MSIGDLVLLRDQFEFILEVLPTEFDSVIVGVNSRPEFVSLDELESLLLTQEIRLKKSKKDVTGVASINLTRGARVGPVQEQQTL